MPQLRNSILFTTHSSFVNTVVPWSIVLLQKCYSALATWLRTVKCLGLLDFGGYKWSLLKIREGNYKREHGGYRWNLEAESCLG
jgi:hypothetical protein